MFARPRNARVIAFVVLVVALGATAFGGGSARAQSAGRTHVSLHVSTKAVKAFIKHRASVVARSQTPLFPNARIYKTGASTSCASLRKWRRWVCAWHAYVYEESKRDPEPYQVRQRTFRYCTTPDDPRTHGVVEVRRARASRSLRVSTPWLVACDLTEDSIESWNVFAYTPDQVWQPTRSEPLAVPQATLPPPQPVPRELAPAPAGEPGGPPPGPLSIGAEPRAAARAVAHATSYVWREGSWLGCSPWMRYVNDPRYWVFYCYWRPQSMAEVPGAGLGIFSREVVTYWEGYYWAENDNFGRPTGKLFASGQF